MPPAECRPRGTAAARVALVGPRDTELFHLFLQRGSLHPQASRGPFRPANHPVGLAEGVEDEGISVEAVSERHCDHARNLANMTYSGARMLDQNLGRGTFSRPTVLGAESK